MIPCRAAVLAILCLVPGCSGGGLESKPAESESFANEAEELEYIKTLANPSVSQFKRRKELQSKADTAAIFAEMDRNVERQEREKPVREARAQELLAEAVEFERRFDRPTEAVVNHYRKLLSEYSDTDASVIAEKRFRELRKEMEELEAAAAAQK